MNDLFGRELGPDPSVALPVPSVPPPKSGPLPGARFVIEFVGPRSVQATHAVGLLDHRWQAALGTPLAFGMRPGDHAWQPLNARTDGSYDSLALAWNLVQGDHTLSSASAARLLGMAEQFAAVIERRALPLPPAEDVDALVHRAITLRDNLDAGLGLALLPSSGLGSERDLWIECARLGLTFSPEGAFELIAAGHPDPLISVTPINASERFSLAQVQAGASVEGLSAGFRIPRSPDPVASLRALAALASHFESLGWRAFDEDGQLRRPHQIEAMRSDIVQATQVLTDAGFSPGSAEARLIFV